jgi:hypothetical protein
MIPTTIWSPQPESLPDTQIEMAEMPANKIVVMSIHQSRRSSNSLGVALCSVSEMAGSTLVATTP